MHVGKGASAAAEGEVSSLQVEGVASISTASGRGEVRLRPNSRLVTSCEFDGQEGGMGADASICIHLRGANKRRALEYDGGAHCAM